MSNKSLFEKLFEDVMEHDALGIPNEAAEGDDMAEIGGDVGGEGEGEGEDTVTLTLDRATAEALMSALEEVLGGEEGEAGDMESAPEGLPAEGESSEGWSEDSEDDEDSEKEEEDDDKLKESPQAEYKPFSNKGEGMTKKGNSKVGGVAGSPSIHGKAKQTAQTKGTEQYMPMNTKYDDGKSMKVKSTEYNPSGPGKSMFN